MYMFCLEVKEMYIYVLVKASYSESLKKCPDHDVIMWGVNEMG